MRTQFTTDGIDRLKREAKDLRRDNSTLTQNQALDLIAKQHGWNNWALLQRNSVDAGPLELALRPFEPGDRGVFFLKIAIRDSKLLAKSERLGSLSFKLPGVPTNWLIRRFTEVRDFQPDPYLDFRFASPRGRFVKGKFLCVVSTNGVQEPDIESVISVDLHPIRELFRDAATAMLNQVIGSKY
ncbi:glyoxalase superfamily protein [Achromobacter xylosoxidans]|uniref:glyoxalase superfamily protein n=1 Tax=Alcaligenes xylosoxydans xylosoxydans TaxID=85698 RepID=UPI0013AF15D8|nr:glyoxalase superfamily protein [Achromobacter xylosoxidans]